MALTANVPVKSAADQLEDFEAMKAAYEAALAENARLKAGNVKSAPRPSVKVSEKGAVSVYGIGRFPVTLYASQWTKLLAMSEAIAQFISANGDKLAVKGETKAA